MFEDVCLVCSRPVQDARSTYCSDECANQDSAPTTSDDRSSTSSVSSAPSPYLRPATKPPFGPFGLTSPDVDPNSLVASHLALHNPHPTFNDYPLPVEIASPVLAAYSKSSSSAMRSPSSSQKQRLHIQRHMRKRSSLSSSSASSALSTPSQPPLTDDDDSMSDPEFLLDVNVNVGPAIDYARRPSTTNTRSTISHLNTSSSSTSSSVGRTRSRPRHHQRPKHVHHLSAPLVGTAAATQALHDEDYDSLFVADDGRSHHPYTHEDNRNDDLEASYATLTKLSLATHDGASTHTTSSSFGIDTVRQKKSRRSALSLRPRSSLPAYFSLLRMSSPPVRSDLTPSPSPPQADCATQEAAEGSFSSPGSTRTARVSRSEVRPAPESRVCQSNKTQSSEAGTNTNLHPNLHVRAEPVSSISTLHSFGAVYGVRKGVSTSAALNAAKVAARGQGGNINALAAAAALVPLPITPTSPKDLGPSPAHPDVCEDDARSQARLVRPSPAAAALTGFVAAEGTPRGRTRSRSACPRSRSRSRSRSRRARGHFGALSSTHEDGELVASVAAALGFATRGRAHARGIGGRARRGRRGTGTVMPAFGSDGDEDVAAEHAWFTGRHLGSGPRSPPLKREGESENVATQLRGRRRGVGVPVPA